MSNEIEEEQRYIDPNSGAAPQPGGQVSPGLTLETSDDAGASEESSPSKQTDRDSDLGSDVDSTEEPAGNASQEEWAQYAVTMKGADPGDAAEMKRDELREMYGSK